MESSLDSIKSNLKVRVVWGEYKYCIAGLVVVDCLFVFLGLVSRRISK